MDKETKDYKKYITAIVVVAVVALIAIAFYYQNMDKKEQKEGLGKINKIPELEKLEKDGDTNVTEMGVKYIVDPKKIVDGGPPMDGIPSIDDPKFVTVAEADEWIENEELILVLEYEGEKRAYPLQIMTWHEIVNDEVGKSPLLITYCPLCGSGIAYKRIIDGKEVEFGTSGKLYNSNLVMYDRKTNSYWSQIDGRAIVGELTGQELEAINLDTVTWQDWKDQNQDAKVLSKDTGFTRPYGDDPYGSYYTDNYLLFDVENENNIIHPKTVIYGVELDGKYKAYKDEDIAKNSAIEDEIGGVNIKLVKNDVGQVTFTNLDTGEKIVKERGFWFSWYAFHPDTKLYQK